MCELGAHRCALSVGVDMVGAGAVSVSTEVHVLTLGWLAQCYMKTAIVKDQVLPCAKCWHEYLCSLGDLLRVPVPSLRVLGKTGSWNGRMGHHQTSQMGNSGCRLRGTEPHPQASSPEISSPQGTGKEAVRKQRGWCLRSSFVL